MNEYYPGNVITIRGEWTDAVTGDFVDPGTVTAKVKDPRGVTTNYVVTGGQIVKEDVGRYNLDIDPADTQGVWSYEWRGVGANKGSKAEAFKILESQFD